MKRIISFLLAVFMIALIPCTAFADGDGNMDGGGGGMDDAGGKNFWNSGQDGVRITVVRAKDNKPVSIPIDLTNKNESNIYCHFNKKSKLHYRNGASLIPNIKSRYIYTNPSKSLPKVICDNGSSNIVAIKSYFTDRQVLKSIARIIGASYETLINGNYKLLIEPIAYITFLGKRYAMTATEAALYDQKLSGGLRARMKSLSHQNLPLSLFLEKPDLGYPAYKGSKKRPQSNATIISSLGLGVVRFKDTPTIPPTDDNNPSSGGTASYQYRTDTDVITSVNLSASKNITPDSPATVTFNFGGSSYSVSSIVVPEGDSQLVWIKWHTPSTPQTVHISVSSSKGSLSATSITAKVTELKENTPPNPTATDRNDRFSIPNIPKQAERTASSWGTWNAHWVSKWVWHENFQWENHPEWQSGGQWVDKGDWVDEGDWTYNFTSYRAAFTANMSLMPDDKVPTANGKQMRSGYGVKINVVSGVRSSAPRSHYTASQTAITYFPEFYYKSYWRILDLNNSQFQFKNNIYSTYNRRVHFTPVWFPDSKYTAYTYLEDVWTPAGMLSINLTDYVNIYGSVFDDWHISPKLVD